MGTSLPEWDGIRIAGFVMEDGTDFTEIIRINDTTITCDAFESQATRLHQLGITNHWQLNSKFKGYFGDIACDALKFQASRLHQLA